MAISRLQFVNHDGPVSNTDTITISASSAGSLIVVGICADDTLTVSSVTDGTNTYNQVPGARVSSAGLAFSDIWYAQNVSSGITSITITLSGTANSLFRNTVVEYAGAKKIGSPIDTSGNITASGTGAVGPSLTITNAGDALFVTGQVNAAVLTSVNAPWSSAMIDDPKFLYPVDLISPGSTGSFQAVYNPTSAQTFEMSGAAFLPQPPTSHSNMFQVF